MISRSLALIVALLALAGCDRDETPPLLGTLEWDRVDLIAEAPEPVLTIDVREGDRVTANQVLMTLDTRRAQADLDGADAEIARLDAVLAQQRNGARVEAVAEATANLRRAQAVALNASREFTRAKEIRARQLISPQDVDRAAANSNAAQADVRAAGAALELLTNGTRAEEITQTESALLAATARRDSLAVTLSRLTVRAPGAGRVDAIAVEPGDQVSRGAPLITLLSGPAPYARVYIPEQRRAAMARDARFRVTVEGLPTTYDAHLRFVRSEASFTPYYALTGDDASRLTYVAEIELEGDAARELPAGLPVQAVLVDTGTTPAPASR
jgi:HlyD family secretion protein